MTSIRLSEPMEIQLAAVASATRRSKSFIIKEALTQYFEDAEDGLISMERLSAPRAVRYTADEVRALLDIERDTDIG